ncbi:MAG TPA: Hsp70 family protein, partial [Polyangiaceae bacterium]
PTAGQPSAGVPITADIAALKKRTTALGLGGPAPGAAADPGRARTRTDKGLGTATEPAPRVAPAPGAEARPAPAGATLRSAAEQAALARAAAAASDAAARGPAPFAFDIEDDAPTEVRPAPGSAPVDPALDADFLDASELHEVPRGLSEADEDEEETQARHRPPAPHRPTAPSAPILAAPIGAAPPLVSAAPAPVAPRQAATLPSSATPARPAITQPLPAAATRAPTTQPLPAVSARPAATLPLAVPPASPGTTLPLPAATAATSTPVAASHVAAPAAAAPWGTAPASLPPESFELPTPGIPLEETTVPHAPAPGFDFGAVGAAREPQRPVVRGEPPLLIDVTPLTLAVETVGGYCDTVISRNSPIPCEHSRQFATVMDNQDSVRVRVSQGEAPIFAQNTLLGEVLLSGLRAAPRGGVKIEVAFALDPSGMLNVNATDVDTGRSVSTRIRLVGLADPQEVESMRARHAAVPLR